MKRYSETEFIKFVLTQQLLKSLHLLMESGAAVVLVRCVTEDVSSQICVVLCLCSSSVSTSQRTPPMCASLTSSPIRTLMKALWVWPTSPRPNRTSPEVSAPKVTPADSAQPQTGRREAESNSCVFRLQPVRHLPTKNERST